MTETHLTLLTLNPRNRQTQHDLRSPHDMHRTLMRLLPDNIPTAPRATGGLLYRLNKGPNPTLLIQTNQPINPGHLPSDYTLRFATKNTTHLYENLTPGTHIKFTATVSLQTNRRSEHDKTARKRGTPTPITTITNATTWWNNHEQNHGITTQSLTIQPQRTLHITRNNQDIRLPVFTITGIATITNPQNLTHTISNGVGKGKTWGLGLLTIAPR